MSGPINSGGPAFPCEVLADYRDTEPTKFPGMTLRDWFAGQALANGNIEEHSGASWADMVAQQAYRIADAMIAARKGGAK